MGRFDMDSCPGDSRVDHSHHACLAMFPLRAVIPDGFGVIDQDRVRWPRRCLGFNRHVPGEEARDRSVDVVDGDTGLVECRLHNRVILKFLVRHCRDRLGVDQVCTLGQY